MGITIEIVFISKYDEEFVVWRTVTRKERFCWGI